MRFSAAVTVFQVVVTIGWVTQPAFADCGSVVYTAPLRLSYLGGGEGFVIGVGRAVDAGINLAKLPDGSTDVNFDPLQVVVYEPGQRAIILWDGTEEVLLLSTEIRTSEAVSILEVIPLPSKPEVTLGSFSTFEKMQALRIDKQMWAVQGGGGVDDSGLRSRAAWIRFHEQMGAHDVTVVQVLKKDEFTSWVMAYLKNQGAVNPQIDPRFIAIIQRYLDRGFEYFVFDSIDTSDQLLSRQPLQYRFKSNSVFYPLEISTLETGNTLVDLLLVTKKELSRFPSLKPRARLDKPFEISKQELAEVSEEWAAFMKGGSHVQPVRIQGDLSKMTVDFEAW